jgi:hypothetical protein
MAWQFVPEGTHRHLRMPCSRPTIYNPTYNKGKDETDIVKGRAKDKGDAGDPDHVDASSTRSGRKVRILEYLQEYNESANIATNYYQLPLNVTKKATECGFSGVEYSRGRYGR